MSNYPAVFGNCNGRQCGNLKAIESLATRLADAEDRARELELKGLQLVSYLGPLMLAATGVVSGRMGAMDELRRMLDIKYDPTKGEALSLASQLAAANAEIERLKGLIDTWAQSSSEWPTLATLETLANAALHLLAVHDCDAPGHETVWLSEIRAREIIAAVTENREHA